MRHVRCSQPVALQSPFSLPVMAASQPSTLSPANSPHFDVEAQNDAASHRSPRIVYNPSSFLHRLFVAIRIKNKLHTSQIIRIPFCPTYKYLLILLLIFIAAFLTPELLPSAIGFQWATPEDLCQNPDLKLRLISNQLHLLTNLSEANFFLARQQSHLQCMQQSAALFYNGKQSNPPRFRWPDECDIEKAKTSLTETKCVSQKFDVCSVVGGIPSFLISIAGQCHKQVGPELCVETNDKNRTDALFQLEQQRDSVKPINTSEIWSDPIVATSNAKVRSLISRLVLQVDIASDAFILYTIISIAFGTPLVIYKREKGSRIVGATFGMTKVAFVLTFIVVLSTYDSLILILRETDFTRLFQNFIADPCYVDPRFSSRRISLITDVCNNVSRIEQDSNLVLQRMETVYFDTRLFGFCKDETRQPAVHPNLAAMNHLLQRYQSRKLSSPGNCNSTTLNELTSIAPRDHSISKIRALLANGVVAQLLLKFIVTGFVLHFIAFSEPMVIHNGKIEVWGHQAGAQFNKEEQRALNRFARDKHLLPLIVFGTLFLFEVILVIYTITVTFSGSHQIAFAGTPQPSPTPAPVFTCPSSLLPI